MKYFISDHHFGHAAIIRMASRPFETVWEMNKFMIDAWNSVITDKDEVYHLGDIGHKINVNQLNSIMSQLNGKIHLIGGNHDEKYIDKYGKRFTDRFESVQDYKYFEYVQDGVIYKFVLFHYPISSWKHRFRGSIHLHGHTHANAIDDTTGKGIHGHIMNVSVEHLNYKPISIVEVINKFKNIELKIV